MIVVPLLVFLLWVEPGDEYVNKEHVEYAFEDQAFDNSENFAGKMTHPRNHFYLCLLVVRSMAMSHYLPLAISCLPYFHVKPLTHLPSKPLFGYVTAFAQPLL